jgi:hypothetical protein
MAQGSGFRDQLSRGEGVVFVDLKKIDSKEQTAILESWRIVTILTKLLTTY